MSSVVVGKEGSTAGEPISMRLRFPIEFAMQSIDHLADSDVAYLAYSLTRQ